MDMYITGTEQNIFQYMINHRNSWISVRELIKIEEMDPTTGDGGCCSSGDTEDS